MANPDKDQLIHSFNETFESIRLQLIDLQDEAYEKGLARGRLDNLRFTRQQQTLQWACATFGNETADNTAERTQRFAKEAIELAQAVGMDKEAMLNLVEYVYARPTGKLSQEIGQVGISLLALAEHFKISADAEEKAEFERITSLPDKHWQARQNAKADKGIGLPCNAETNATQATAN
ncbi:MAG: hypothetical protein ACXV8O_05040 [Methylobacter sp.]